MFLSAISEVYGNVDDVMSGLSKQSGFILPPSSQGTPERRATAVKINIQVSQLCSRLPACNAATEKKNYLHMRRKDLQASLCSQT